MAPGPCDFNLPQWPAQIITQERHDAIESLWTKIPKEHIQHIAEYIVKEYSLDGPTQGAVSSCTSFWS